MSIAVFNINDAGIQLTVDSELVRTSPGIAVLNNNSLMTGEEAREKVKLLPRWTNNRFWSQLNTNPLPNSTEQVATPRGHRLCSPRRPLATCQQNSGQCYSDRPGVLPQ